MTDRLDPETREQLRVALEDVLKTIRARPRRTDFEAKPELARAYPQLLIAMALTRIDELHRARELSDEARAAITSDANRKTDVVHTFLLTTFGLRFEEALAGQPMRSFLCERTRAALGEIARIPRYKIDSFRQQLPTIDAPSRSAVVAAYGRPGPVDEPPAELPDVEVVELAVLDETFDCKQSDASPQRLARLRAIARGYARAPVAVAADGMRRFAGLVSDTSDTYGTNSHFLQSLVHVVASCCLIVEELT